MTRAPAARRPCRALAPLRSRSPKLQLEYQLTVLATLALVAFGLVMVFSATSATATLGGGNARAYLRAPGRLGLRRSGAMIAFSRFNYRALRNIAPSLLVVRAGPLPGRARDRRRGEGRRRWLSIGPVTLQPSELVKLALALWIPARLLRHRRPRTLGELAKPVGFMVALACALIAARSPTSAR